MPKHPHSRRFRAARGLYHAIVTSRESQRLITRSYSWDQKASRAFAAELLAPRRALVRRLPTTAADLQMIERLSEDFGASGILIEKQLENAGVPLSYE
jgi:Zn-dependent peptidase ImmA (M78 family)